jgi:hypothetical protein
MPAYTKYNTFLKTQMNGGGGTAARVVDFDTDTIKVMLVSSTYVPDVAGHQVKTSITNEVTGSNYTAGGTTISSPTLTEAAGVVTFGGANITWPQSPTGFSNARYAIIYKSTGVDSTSTLIGYYDLLTDQSNVTVPYSIIFNALGIVTWE